MGERSRHALFSLLLCASVHAAAPHRAPNTFSLSIDRQPLDSALRQLASQCGVQMIYFSRVTEGLSSPTIEGDYTLPVAMERMLAGSGLTFDLINPQTIEVRPLQARPGDRSRSPAPRAVSQSQKLSDEAGPLEEVVVVGLAEQLVATRIATPLREVPQTISIVTREQMRQRNEFTLADALEHAPGITTVRTSAVDQDFYARAYQITAFHIDGGAAVNPKLDPVGLSGVLYLATPDLIEFDHLEILRGADGLFSGNANPGGAISLVRKRPQRNFALDVDAAGGSWDNGRVAVDITGPLALDGAFRGRAAAVYSHQGYFYAIGPHEKTKVFGALEYDFTDEATLTAGASYQWDEASSLGAGVPFYSDGRDSRLPRDTALEFEWANYRSDLRGVYFQYRQQFASEWALRVNASAWRTAAEFADGNFTEIIDPVTNELNGPSAGFSATPNVYEQKTADVTLTGTLDWFGLREELAIGGDFTRLEFRGNSEIFLGIGEPLRNLRAFDPHAYPDPRLASLPDFGVATTSTTDQYGMFASLRIDFDDAWSIMGGARISGDRRDAQLTLHTNLLPLPDLVVPADASTDHVVTPYAALMYSFDRHYSLYASYADVYLSQGMLMRRASGELLGPIRGVNIEAGVKGEWRNGALNGALAVYRTKQSNLSTRTAQPGLDINCCFTGVSTSSRGVDIELTGEMMPGWNIGAGYAYNISESPPSQPLALEAGALTPKHLLKAWTNVRLPGRFSRWQIGGSLHAQTKTTSPIVPCPPDIPFECIPVDAVQPAYAVFDLRAGFDVDRHWRVTLTVNNVLDESYYETIDSSSWYGEPRNWMLLIDGRY